ncbi:hypothetical protein CRG98_016893 [Punica granatum]|uniref:Uncharacterized protein n=1 Tax=Punica granatum TaxID=22663 RepID=A0A2I0K2D6_PUNGR|nr:hypothetical protein CRG98_016893 [Punica granatum]
MEQKDSKTTKPTEPQAKAQEAPKSDSESQTWVKAVGHYLCCCWICCDSTTPTKGTNK